MESITVRGLYDFQGEAEGELSFHKGDKLLVIDKNVGMGWWRAKNSEGMLGLIPEGFVEVVDEVPSVNEVPPVQQHYGNIQDIPLELNQDTTSYDAVDGMQANSGASINDAADDPWRISWAVNPNAAVSGVPRPSAPIQQGVGRAFQPNQHIRHPVHSHSQASAYATHQHTHTLDDSDFDDEYEENYSNVQDPRTYTRTQNRTASIRTRFFDKKGLDAYLMTNTKVSVSEPDMVVVIRNPNGDLQWEQRGFQSKSYMISATNEATKLGGLKQFTLYFVSPRGADSKLGVSRRFKQFDWMHDMLCEKFKLLCIPGLPEKQMTGRFEQEFIDERKRQLEMWVNRIARHPIMGKWPAVVQFLNQELNYSSNISVKEWKRFKRDTERDPLRGARWFHCIKTDFDALPYAEADSSVDTFVQFASNFEKSIQLLMASLSKYIEFHAAMKREFLKVSGAFRNLAEAFYADDTANGSRQLSLSIEIVSKAYANISSDFAEKATRGIYDLFFAFREYATMLASMQTPIGIQRDSRDMLPGILNRFQGKIPPDVTGRLTAINAAVLSEITLFNEQRIADFRENIKQYLRLQKQLYFDIAKEFEEAEKAF